ncbi:MULTISPECIES: recombination mediator RecR [Anaerococcus]|uniref:Recombination protein RecR n=1 Tax=Anaerococcus octavius TaxID=54007 RepID=A0A2I1M9T0_9FIRM|nr:MULTISPECIES: recombination mediator RecR [Anaerococcus]MBS6105771.1 recombination mediator RecR [Anaerococcus sp.]MDU2598517.1 recombination mediator RecR [Anaerococcus sp.]MDU3176258.1 recombination mediator RecR [Anaerococcus sp.]MDU4025439.1 recombination mediator RecR [Anaerococcus sp.]MDU5535295.1 recombination mediator RecR [Anaerococcus sp.]
MAIFPESLDNLIGEFQKLPTIGRKSAERLAMNIVDRDQADIKDFANALLEVKEKIHRCEICGNLTEDDICDVCKDITREEDFICIVEDVKDLIAIEKSGAYHGKYHVLGGLISPSDGIGPDELNIDKLLNRIEKEGINEIILAISSTIEGETTSLFLTSLLNEKSIKVTKIAQGIPVGSNLEYFDQLTLERAIEDRREIRD